MRHCQIDPTCQFFPFFLSSSSHLSCSSSCNRTHGRTRCSSAPRAALRSRDAACTPRRRPTALLPSAATPPLLLARHASVPRRRRSMKPVLCSPAPPPSELLRGLRRLRRARAHALALSSPCPRWVEPIRQISGDRRAPHLRGIFDVGRLRPV